jgi:hypothetical protein
VPSKIDWFRDGLRASKDVGAYLKRNSGLPGPRGNLELAQAFAAEASPDQIWSFARLEARRAPENTPEGFLACCGILGLGRLAMEGDRRAEELLLARSADSRWRVREMVSMALQAIGDVDRAQMSRLVRLLAKGGPLEKRAAVAAAAEPRLLADSASVTLALRVLDGATRSLAKTRKPLGEEERILRQGLAYAWSVVVAADPARGKPAMEAWLKSMDPDVAWLMRENLGKKRLLAVDARWCEMWGRRLRGATRAAARQ